MKQWIPFREGEYLVVRAFLVSPDNGIEPVDRAVIDIYADSTGMRQLKGSGRVENYKMVALLENHGSLDLILELGEDLIYRLPAPELTAGKVFTPGVRSMMQFKPTEPWQSMSTKDLDDLLENAQRP
ncbi:MAG: hypothetical protein ABIL58_27015 [Pseudomonadota bacterium]